MEAETLLRIAVRLGYVEEDQVLDLLGQIVEISEMLTALRTRLLE
jgi:four helix bundle protein